VPPFDLAAAAPPSTAAPSTAAGESPPLRRPRPLRPREIILHGPLRPRQIEVDATLEASEDDWKSAQTLLGRPSTVATTVRAELSVEDTAVDGAKPGETRLLQPLNRGRRPMRHRWAADGQCALHRCTHDVRRVQRCCRCAAVDRCAHLRCAAVDRRALQLVMANHAASGTKCRLPRAISSRPSPASAAASSADHHGA
jgi:hypothetical protein